MRRIYRWIGLLLAAGMTVSAVPVSAFAEAAGAHFPAAAAAQSAGEEPGTARTGVGPDGDLWVSKDGYPYYGFYEEEPDVEFLDENPSGNSWGASNLKGEYPHLDLRAGEYDFSAFPSLRETIEISLGSGVTISGGVFHSVIAGTGSEAALLTGGTFYKPVQSQGASLQLFGGTYHQAINDPEASFPTQVYAGVFRQDPRQTSGTAGAQIMGNCYALTAENCTINGILDTVYIAATQETQPEVQLELPPEAGELQVYTGGKTITLEEWCGASLPPSGGVVYFSAPAQGQDAVLKAVKEKTILLPEGVLEVETETAGTTARLATEATPEGARKITVQENTVVRFSVTPETALCRDAAGTTLAKNEAGQYVLTADRDIAVRQYNRLEVDDAGKPVCTNTYKELRDGAVVYCGEGWELEESTGVLTLTGAQNLSRETSALQVPVVLKTPEQGELCITGGTFEKTVTVQENTVLENAALRGGAVLQGGRVRDSSVTLWGKDRLQLCSGDTAPALLENCRVDAAGYTGEEPAILVESGGGSKSEISGGEITLPENGMLVNRGVLSDLTVRGGTILNSGVLDTGKNVVGADVVCDGEGWSCSGIFAGNVQAGSGGNIRQAVVFGELTGAESADLTLAVKDSAQPVTLWGVECPDGTVVHTVGQPQLEAAAPADIAAPVWSADREEVFPRQDRYDRVLQFSMPGGNTTLTVAQRSFVSRIPMNADGTPAAEGGEGWSYTETVNDRGETVKTLRVEPGYTAVFDPDALVAVPVTAAGTQTEPAQLRGGIFRGETLVLEGSSTVEDALQWGGSLICSSESAKGQILTLPAGATLNGVQLPMDRDTVEVRVFGSHKMLTLTMPADTEKMHWTVTDELGAEVSSLPGQTGSLQDDTVQFSMGDHASLCFGLEPDPEPEPEPPVVQYPITLPDPNPYGVEAAGAEGETLTEAQAGTVVHLQYQLALLPEDQMLDGWAVTTPEGTAVQVEQEEGRYHFVMPESPVTLALKLRAVEVDPEKPEPPEPSESEEKPAPEEPAAPGQGAMLLPAAGIAAGAALGTAGYLGATGLYLRVVLPVGAEIPDSCGELAALLWETAGSPRPVSDPELTGTPAALRWCAEQGLLGTQAAADRPVTRWQVIRSWKALQKKLHI